MTNTVLENDRLLIEVDQHGAELTRIYDKKKKREVLWEAKPEIWSRHAPVLFPFIGKCIDGKYCYHGKEWDMTPHGFARDTEFDLAKLSGDEVWYTLTDSETSLCIYPFHFKLEIGHKLEDGNITVMWRVTNTGDGEMLFMLGGHPAFKTPEGCSVHDFTFEFDKQDSLHFEAPNTEGYADPALQGRLALAEGKVPLTEGFFEKTLTYIFDQGQVERVSLKLPENEPYVTVHCKGIPYLGVWTMEKTHPFVCLEPWFGRCPDQGFAGELKDRPGIMKLAAGELFQADYVIEIH